MVKPKNVSKKDELIKVVDDHIMPLVFGFIKKGKLLVVNNEIPQYLIEEGIGN